MLGETSCGGRACRGGFCGRPRVWEKLCLGAVLAASGPDGCFGAVSPTRASQGCAGPLVWRSLLPQGSAVSHCLCAGLSLCAGWRPFGFGYLMAAPGLRRRLGFAWPGFGAWPWVGTRLGWADQAGLKGLSVVSFSLAAGVTRARGDLHRLGCARLCGRRCMEAKGWSAHQLRMRRVFGSGHSGAGVREDSAEDIESKQPLVCFAGTPSFTALPSLQLWSARLMQRLGALLGTSPGPAYLNTSGHVVPGALPFLSIHQCPLFLSVKRTRQRCAFRAGASSVPAVMPAS